MSTGLAIRAEHVSHEYDLDGERIRALTDVTFTVEAGHRLAIIGPSGSGKSTLLTVLAGLQRPTAGSVHIGAQDLTSLTERELAALRRGPVAVVVQDPRRNLLPYGTALDNIRFAQRAAGRRARRRDPAQILEALGLHALRDERIDRLSGGERQRIAIATGLALDPGLVLVDEPTSALDAQSRDDVLDLLERVATGSGATLIAITHDRDVADRLGSIIELAGGEV